MEDWARVRSAPVTQVSVGLQVGTGQFFFSSKLEICLFIIAASIPKFRCGVFVVLGAKEIPVPERLF
jgi:hypothetical protein